MSHTPTAAVTRVVRRATLLTVLSLSFGTNAIRSTPTSGRNTAAVRAHESKFIVLVLLAGGEDEGEADDGHRAEEGGRVLLDAAGLHGAKGGAALFGACAGTVDDAVDH